MDLYIHPWVTVQCAVGRDSLNMPLLPSLRQLRCWPGKSCSHAANPTHLSRHHTFVPTTLHYDVQKPQTLHVCLNLRTACLRRHYTFVPTTLHVQADTTHLSQQPYTPKQTLHTCPNNFACLSRHYTLVPTTLHV